MQDPNLMWRTLACIRTRVRCMTRLSNLLLWYVFLPEMSQLASLINMQDKSRPDGVSPEEVSTNSV
jgi:hypothetical protein